MNSVKALFTMVTLSGAIAGAQGTTTDSAVCLASTTSGLHVDSGKDGFLFRTLADIDFRQVFPVDAAMQQSMNALGKAFRDAGYTVVAIPLPPRGLAEAEHLDYSRATTAKYDEKLARTQFEGYIDALRKAGFITIDGLKISDTLGGDFFQKTDHHWTAEAARAVSIEIAKQIKPLSIYSGLPKKQYSTVLAGHTNVAGSLTSEVKKYCPTTTIPNETLDQWVTKDESPADQSSLLGSDTPPVVVLGTSNSLNGPANFLGFLREYLGLDATQASFSGAGTQGAIEHYFTNPNVDREPKILIWEFESVASFFATNPDRVMTGTWMGPQVIPAILDSCKAAPAGQKVGFQTGQSVTVPIDGQKVAANQPLALKVKFDDLSVVNFTIKSTFTTGKDKINYYVRSTVLPNSGYYYLQYSAEDAKMLQNISISVPADMHPTGQVSITTCT